MIRQSLLFFVICVLLLIANQTLPNILNPYIYMILTYCGINIIMGVSLNVINGLTGQFSMGHAGFMAIGAYTSAALSFYLFNPLVSSIAREGNMLGMAAQQSFFVISVLIGGFMAAIAGYLVGLPSLKLRGDYLGIVTLGFGEIIRVMILNIDFLGGARGFSGIPPWANFFWIYFFVAALVITCFRMLKSYHGRALLSIREDEIAAESIGINITAYKVKAFIFSSFFAGISGGLLAHFLVYLNPSSFTFIKSFEAIIIVILGGMGSITGSMVAAVITTILPEALRPLQEITKIDVRMVIYPLLLIALMLTRPAGLFGQKEFYDLWPFKRKGSR
ncbi:MAG: branched-chain amino acid ABC transporter permease [Deltaproteobacteria bacterium]